MTLAGLLYPALLGLGAAAALVPIVIHLLSRRRVKPIRWAAMQWLLAALKRHQRRLRMENWLVLLLRVAALVLLGLGLSRWILTDSSLASLLRPKRTVILLLDTSYSTGAKDGARSVSDRVRAEADRVLSGLSKDDTVAVLVSNDVTPDRTGTHPAVLVPRTVGREGAARAKEAVGNVRPTEAPADWGEALALAASNEVLRPEDVNRTLVWGTDLQARDWKKPADGNAADALAKGIRAVHAMPCAIRVVDASGGGARTLPNLSVAEVATDDRGGDLFEKSTLTLRVKAWNHGPDAVEGAFLRVFLDDQPSPARTVALDRLPPADPTTLDPGSTTATVRLSRDAAFQTAGAHSVRVEIAPRDEDASTDALGLDSRRFLALSVRAKLRVAAWTEPTKGARFLPSWLLRGVYVGEGKGDHFDLRTFSSEAQLRDQLADPTWEPDLVVFANVAPRSREMQQELAAWIRAGGALLVFVGDRVDPAEWNVPFFAGPGGGSVARLLPFRYGPRELPPAERLETNAYRLDFEVQTSSPLSRRLVGDEFLLRLLRVANPFVYGRMALLDERPSPPGMTPSPSTGRRIADDDAVVLRFAGPQGQPGPVAVAEARLGQGRAVFTAFGLDDGWTVDDFFLPVFLNETALELTRREGTDHDLAVGQGIHAPLPRDASAPKLVIPGRGEVTPPTKAPETESDRPAVVYERVGTSGLWRLSYQRQGARGTAPAPKRTEALFAVNPDPAEGALRRAAVPDVKARVPGADLEVLPTYEAGDAAGEDRRQGDLSTYVLLAVFLLLLGESFLAMKFGRHDRKETPSEGERKATPSEPAPGAPPAPPARAAL